jgi:type II secretory pathway pseudopilin PulG
MQHRSRRSAYTLLEVVLALVIGVLLLACVYGAVSYQLRQAQAGREAVEQTHLVRAVVSKMESDISATVTLSDPSRFRSQPNSQTNMASSGGGAMSGMTSTPSGATSTTTTSSSTSGSGSTSGSSSSSSQTSNVVPVSLPLGVIGDSASVSLYISRVPTEVWASQNNQAPPVASDLRRITYWMDGSRGLCRLEQRVITSADALDSSIPPANSDASQALMSKDVKSLEISYFDGTTWQDSWDSTTVGDDGDTPIGSPRAIAIKIGYLPRRAPGDFTVGQQNSQLKYYRHVIAIQTANGATQANNNATNPNSSSTQGSGGGS